MSINKNLPSRLCYLPIDLADRLHLWLTYKGIKKASTILFPNPDKDTGNKKARRVEKWLSDSNIFFLRDKQNKRLVHISKDMDNAKLLLKLQWSNLLDDIITRGLLYGYPKLATKAFAEAWNEKSLPKKLASTQEVDTELKDKYWRHFLTYAVRKKHITSDSGEAKKWADEIKTSIPLLYKWIVP